jgi:VIT1/CCC1 family predicted Fe2+/Mn2+ transporter
MFKHSLKTGLSFGLTSGIITTLGLMVGLHAGTQSKLVVIGGILTIAIADAFSDALGIHVSEESENIHSGKEIWVTTCFTFLSKFIFAFTFVIPVLLFELQTAIYVSIIWGLLILSIFSFSMGRRQKVNPWIVVGEHVGITLIVIFLTHTIGRWIAATFR